MKRILTIFLLICSSLFAQVLGGKAVVGGKMTYGKGAAAANPSVHSTCTGNVAFGDITCVYSPNILSSSILYVSVVPAGATAVTVSGCGATWTTDTVVSPGATQSTGTTPSAGACTVTVHVTAGTDSVKAMAGVEVTNTSGIDARGTMADQGFKGPPGTSIGCPTVTTTVNNDLVVCGVTDYSGNGTTFSPDGVSTIAVQSSQTTARNAGIETYVAPTPNAIFLSYTYDANSSFATGAVAFKP